MKSNSFLLRKLEAWARNKDWVRYLDSTSYLMDAKGQPIREYYVDDLLHLSLAGYAEWLKLLRPIGWEKVR